jgi:dTDP-4-amino-4,6-dideoxygalactose transaminase
MKIPYVSLSTQWKKEKKYLNPIIQKVLEQGEYVNGKEIDKFEKNISALCRTKYAVALNSGTDALLLSLHLLGIKRGDEIITPPNSFISSTSVIVHIGAKPVFVDVLEDQNIKFSFLGSIKLLTSNIPYGKRKLLILFDLLFTFRK